MMRTRITILILLVAVFQLLTFAAVLMFGGVFSELEESSYHMLAEKTDGRSTYLQNVLWERAFAVQTYAEQLNDAVTGILEERGASIADLQTDKALNESIIAASSELVSGLLRRSGADEAYFILDTGDLYAEDGGETAKAALYLQGTGSNAGGEAGDLLTVFGLGSDPRYFMPDPRSETNFDFYYRTLQTARENRGSAQDALGYWGVFSRASSESPSSMKYSLPLLAADGTAYGVVGVGLTENTVLSTFSSDASLGESACYVLGKKTSDTTFQALNHSGSAYRALLGSTDTLHIIDTEGEGVYRFKQITDVELLGGVQEMELYAGGSPYAAEEWVLIIVADRSSVLHPLLVLQRMAAVSVPLSLIVVAIVAVPGCGVIVKPLSNLSKQLRAKRKYNEVVRFEPSNIYEIDEITDAVTQLQINVHGYSSQVSKMISIANVGVGTFMYDRTDDSVFVGQSLIKVLRLNLPKNEDTVMSRQEFLNSIGEPEVRAPIAAGLGMAGGEVRGDQSKVYQIKQMNGSTFWMRLGYTYSPNTAICIVQDITDAMIEKNRIEHERDYDTLTGLLTRNAYYRYVEELFHDRTKLKVTAFVMLDLDNLKYVNDTYGHDFGDNYIKTAATALERFQEHGGIVARLSGDEFNVCLPGFSSKEEAREIIAGVRTELLQSSCLLADGTHFKVSASMGVSWYPDDADSRELLMKYADFAMYTIKHSTKGGIAEFDMNVYSADSVLLTGVEEMNRVIEDRSVKYAFQSIVSAKTGEIYGYEALMRVQSEIFQSPLELLRIAKTGARLHEIERLTWTKALEDFQDLVDAGRIEKTAHIFINSLANNRLEQEVEAFLEEKYPHLLHQIVLEVLEGESSDDDCTTHKAQLMQKWGGQHALDDFGTGYNSEYALLSLRPNIIKIDRSIISGCDRDADRRMIIENLVKLARAREVLVLAEGVETREELETVISCGVDFLQGFYLALPLFDPEPLAPGLASTIRRLAKAGGASEGDNGSV